MKFKIISRWIIAICYLGPILFHIFGLLYLILTGTKIPVKEIIDYTGYVSTIWILTSFLWLIAFIFSVVGIIYSLMKKQWWPALGKIFLSACIGISLFVYFHAIGFGIMATQYSDPEWLRQEEAASYGYNATCTHTLENCNFSFIENKL